MDWTNEKCYGQVSFKAMSTAKTYDAEGTEENIRRLHALLNKVIKQRKEIEVSILLFSFT